MRTSPKRQAIDALSLRDGMASNGVRVLPFGNGRSYGDTCLNDEGTLVDSRSMRRVLSFDPRTGLFCAEAGILLSEITAHVAPHGWFLPVTPGTQFVTLGGAIANDVHGKNHHKRGTFGRWVEEFELVRSDRGKVVCNRDDEPELFSATISGLGLTGLITRATIQLLKVPSLTIHQTVSRFDRLEDYFDLAEEADERHEYAVAWIDSLKGGRSFGRGHLITGDHAEEGDRRGIARKPLADIFIRPPVSPLRGPALKLFNEIYYRRAGNVASQSRVAFDGFFYPLDRITRWNRLYGRKGLHQHQSVVPFEGGREAIAALIDCARSRGHGSFLTVLKRFGDLPSPGFMSFPRPGYTLTLDFPHLGQRTLDLLDELDAIAIGAGGAVNPYKDSRMAPQTFEAGFVKWRRLEAIRDPVVLSDFWRRTALAIDI